MKNHKQLLADFYLALLNIPITEKFRLLHQQLYVAILEAIAEELCEKEEDVQRIFEKMASEDAKAN